MNEVAAKTRAAHLNRNVPWYKPPGTKYEARSIPKGAVDRIIALGGSSNYNVDWGVVEIDRCGERMIEL